MPDCEAINRDIYRELPACIGRGYQKLGRREEALAWFDKSIAMQPEKHEAYFYKAECLMETGPARGSGGPLRQHRRHAGELQHHQQPVRHHPDLQPLLPGAHTCTSGANTPPPGGAPGIPERANTRRWSKPGSCWAAANWPWARPRPPPTAGPRPSDLNPHRHAGTARPAPGAPTAGPPRDFADALRDRPPAFPGTAGFRPGTDLPFPERADLGPSAPPPAATLPAAAGTAADRVPP